MNKRIQFNDETYHSYYNSDKKLALNLFFENSNLNQLQIKLSDENPQIKNKTLIVKPLNKTNVISTSHEKHFEKNNKKVIEYYYDNILDHYAEIETNSNFEKTECFGKDRELFSRIIIEFNSYGKPIKEKQYIKNMDGTILEYEKEFGAI